MFLLQTKVVWLELVSGREIYTPRCNLKDPRNITIIHRPDEALEIQSELIFVNGMVHLLHELNFGTPTTLPLPATPPSPLTATPEATPEAIFGAANLLEVENLRVQNFVAS